MAKNKGPLNGGANLGVEEKLWQAADKLRVMVRRALRQYRYPRDKQRMNSASTCPIFRIIGAVLMGEYQL